jgi:hypothetical protein
VDSKVGAVRLLVLVGGAAAFAPPIKWQHRMARLLFAPAESQPGEHNKLICAERWRAACESSATSFRLFACRPRTSTPPPPPRKPDAGGTKSFKVLIGFELNRSGRSRRHSNESIDGK